MAHYLMIDFGSTFTKLVAVDGTRIEVVATAISPTTVTTDIRTGYRVALADLTKKIGKPIVFDRIIACSSAAGGLKMAAIGLVEELTVEAAKRVCLGAGAKVDLVFAHHCTQAEIQEITTKKIDIVLLAGGADGGNSECALFNLRLLGQAGIKIPIVYAGNKSCQDEVARLFLEYGLDGTIADNVMPRINQLNIQSARDAIRAIFLKKIILAKGIKKIEEEIDEVVLPTPEAVLNAAELLSKGYMKESGLGELVIIDIGGATTDLYSVCHATKRSDVIVHGLEEPYAKRTVEGDLGLRWSALGIVKALTAEEIGLINQDQGIDIRAEAERRFGDIAFVPDDDRQEAIDRLLAEMCAYKAMSRHAGRMEEVFTPMGMVYNQSGKDLTDVQTVIGTGGPVIHARHPAAILAKTANVFHNTSELRPANPQYYLDKDYLLAAMGLYARIDPVGALKIMKKHLQQVQ
ncbi:MAG: methylaspartate mutase accessory protein GlmL [bacterium]